MKIKEGRLPGVLIIEPDFFADQRGYFMETWNSKKYTEFGIREEFVQDNISFSTMGVLRGLHFQHPHGQGKLVYVLTGEVFDVVVDIRRYSPTFGMWEGFHLTAENKLQVYIPEGFAHGFCVTGKDTHFVYKCTEYYNPATESGILWSDPSINISWPFENPILSDKDSKLPLLGEIQPDGLPSIGVNDE